MLQIRIMKRQRKLVLRSLRHGADPLAGRQLVQSRHVVVRRNIDALALVASGLPHGCFGC
jgi:hypothetical protein